MSVVAGSLPLSLSASSVEYAVEPAAVQIRLPASVPS
jgi:hypothetical protein